MIREEERRGEKERGRRRQRLYDKRREDRKRGRRRE